MTIRTMNVTAAAIALALAVSGCGRADEAPMTVPSGASTGQLSLASCVYETSRGDFQAECGTFVVVENRSAPSSRLIVLPVVRILATSEGPDEPIFYLAGGPGASNLGFSRLTGLIDNHDVVLVGYRGVDGSVVLDCPEVNAVLKDPPGDLLDAETMEELAAAYSVCATRLHEEGVDTDGYTLTEVVDDMEEARAALGYERVDLLSQSYGTRLAMIYAWRYPESVHRSAMISVNPPGHFIWFPEIIDSQLEYYSRLCARDSVCSARTDDLAETMRQVAADMPDRWLAFRIKRGNVMAGTFMMLYHTGTAAKLFDAWLAAAEGDFSGLAMMSLAIDLMLPKVPHMGESAAKATSSDYIYDPSRDFIAEMNPPGTIIGAPASLLGWYAGKGWPAKLIPEEYRTVQPSDVEMLLVSGSIDFSTPAQVSTDALLPYLPNGRQVILSEFGHTGDVWGLQPEATVRLLTSFYDTGIADESLFEYQPMNFDAGFGYPKIMKIGLTAILVAFLVIGAAFWLIARRLLRERT